jgi:hypothetical protein
MTVIPIRAIERAQVHLSSTAANTVQTKRPGGTQSRNDGGNKNACSRSHSMKFCGIPEGS